MTDKIVIKAPNFDAVVEEYVAAYEDLHHQSCTIERNGTWYRVNNGESRFRVSELKRMAEELRRRKVVQNMAYDEGKTRWDTYFSRLSLEQLLRLRENELDRLKASTEEYERGARCMAISKTRISEMSLVLKEKYGVVI